jgi:hypothetical protein
MTNTYKENSILSVVNYGLQNKSNFDIVTKETRDIVDIPYFPAQNLVDFSGKLNLYKPVVDIWLPFIEEKEVEDDEGNITIQKEYKVYGLLGRPDARYIFVELGNGYRKLQYRFNGERFPQARMQHGITFNGKDKLFIFGGFMNGRCSNDLWMYDFKQNRWEMLNFSLIEKSANEQPSRRKHLSLYYNEDIDELFIFGGETDILTDLGDYGKGSGNFYIKLNDLWSFNPSSKEWVNYDPYRKLPHRDGVIIYADQSEIHLLVKGGIKEGSLTGEYENPTIYIIDRPTGDIKEKVELNDSDIPFPINPSEVITTRLRGENYIIVGARYNIDYTKNNTIYGTNYSNTSVYVYEITTDDNGNKHYQFKLKKSGITGIYNDNYYFVVYLNKKVDGLFKEYYNDHNGNPNFTFDKIHGLANKTFAKYILGLTDDEANNLSQDVIDDLGRKYTLVDVIEADICKLDTDEIIEQKKIYVPPVFELSHIVHLYEKDYKTGQETSKFVWLYGSKYSYEDETNTQNRKEIILKLNEECYIWEFQFH